MRQVCSIAYVQEEGRGGGWGDSVQSHTYKGREGWGVGPLCAIAYKTMVLVYVCTCVYASISASARVTTNAVTECAPGVLVHRPLAIYSG